MTCTCFEGEDNMSAELELRWLKTEDVKGAVKRFAEFCKEDVREQAKQEGFDLNMYQNAVKLVMQKLDTSLSIDEIFSVEQQEEVSDAD